MSDLIERLEAEEKITRYHGYYARVKSDDLAEAISALKTLRGIESAKRILIEWDEEVKIWRVNTFTSEGWQSGKTVFLAVDAAVGAREKGVK